MAQLDAMVFSNAPPHSSLVLNHDGPPAELIAACDAMHDADKAAEKLKSRLKIGFIVFGIVGFLSLFIAAELPFGWIFVGASLLVMGILGVLWFVRGKHDVDDSRLHTVRHLIRVLGPELKKGRPVRAKVDFAGYGKSKAQSLPGGKELLERPWLWLRLTLADGTQVALRAVTTVKRKKKSKRKYTKVKDRIVDSLEIILRAPRGLTVREVSMDQLRSALGKEFPMKLANGQLKGRVARLSFRTRPALRLKGRSGWTGSDLEHLLDGRQTLLAVAASYRSLIARPQAS